MGKSQPLVRASGFLVHSLPILPFSDNENDAVDADIERDIGTPRRTFQCLFTMLIRMKVVMMVMMMMIMVTMIMIIVESLQTTVMPVRYVILMLIVMIMMM